MRRKNKSSMSLGARLCSDHFQEWVQKGRICFNKPTKLRHASHTNTYSLKRPIDVKNCGSSRLPLRAFEKGDNGDM